MVYIGVDGGGTKTAAAAFENGRMIASAVSGPMNYNFIGVEQAAAYLIAAVDGLHIPRERIAAIGIGDPSLDDGLPAGEDTPAHRFVARVRQALGVPVYVRSDAYITLFGLTGGEESAVLLLSGTGAMAIAENASHEIRVAGGWGRLTGDEGSGYYIATEGIRAALRAADGIAPDTALTRAASDYFQVNCLRELVAVFYGDSEPDIAGFARRVAECAEAGDAVSRGILLDAARFLADYTGALIDWSGSCRVGVYGSVICGNATVRAAYESILLGRYPQLTISEPPVSAERAAAQYAERKDG